MKTDAEDKSMSKALIAQMISRLNSQKSADRSNSGALYNLQETHFFSDWLFVSVFGFRANEYPELVIGLPDLSDLVSEERQVNRELFENLALPPAGKIVEKFLKGKSLIDLGSGNPKKSIGGRLVAERLGATAYIAVDSQLGDLSSDYSPLPSFLIEADMTDFLNVCPLELPKAFLMSGIEIDQNHHSRGLEYCKVISDGMVRKLQENEIVVLCMSSRDFEFERYGLKKIFEDPFIEIYLKQPKFSLHRWIKSWFTSER